METRREREGTRVSTPENQQRASREVGASCLWVEEMRIQGLHWARGEGEEYRASAPAGERRVYVRIGLGAR